MNRGKDFLPNLQDDTKGRDTARPRLVSRIESEYGLSETFVHWAEAAGLQARGYAEAMPLLEAGIASALILLLVLS